MFNFHTFYILKEGGNVFKNLPVGRIKKADVEPTVKFVSDILNINLCNNIIGSAGKKETSGDIDIAIDITKHDREEFCETLQEWCEKRKLDPKDYVAKTGISCHFRCPVPNTDSFCQIDLMFVPDVKFAKFAYASDEEEPLKARHRHIVMSAIAKYNGLKWKNVEGLYDVETTSCLEAHDPDMVAKILLSNSGATRNDLKTVPNIIKFLKKSYNTQDIIDMLDEAKQTIEKDGVNLNNYIQDKPITEAVGNRKGIPHLYSEYKPDQYSMQYSDFIKFIGSLDKDGGILTPGNSVVSEKADGLSIRFGINSENKFFMQGSYSGPVTDGNFDGKIKHEPVKEAFEKNFNKIKRLVEPDLKRYCKAMELDGIVIHAEWLYSPLAIQRNDDPKTVYFVATNYAKDKLGKWSTFPIINITNYNGNELTDNAQEIVTKTLQDLSNEDVIFLPLNIPVFSPIDLSGEVDKVKQEINTFAVQQPDFEQVLSNKSLKRQDQTKKKEIQKSLTRVLLPYQRKMHEKIYTNLANLAGKLGDIEGIVIKFKSNNKNITFKVINPKFHQQKGRK